MPDEKANIFKVRYLYGRHGRICGGHKREGGAHYPGRSPCLSPTMASSVTTVPETVPEGRGEVSRGHSRFVDRTEGLNMNHGA